MSRLSESFFKPQRYRRKFDSGSIDIAWNAKQVVEDVRTNVQRGLRAGMGVVKLRAAANLGRIRSSSKWKKPGGFGWWRRIRAHGFLKSSMKTTDYETKAGIPGSALILSSIAIPVEHGTKRGKRGYYRRGSNQYTERQSAGRSKRNVQEYTGARGPSKAKPFLKPAVRDSASTIRAALGRGGRRS